MPVVSKARLLLASMVLLISGAQAANWISIDFPSASHTEVHGINIQGDMVGLYEQGGVQHAFLLQNSVYSTIDPPNSVAAGATGINDSGQVTGWYQTSDTRLHSFLFDGSNYTKLNVPGATNTVAQGINTIGEIVGYYESGGTKGFKWSNGNFATIDDPKGVFTEARGIDNLHHNVGIYVDTDGKTHNFIENGEGVYRTLHFAGESYGINDHKLIVGTGVGSDGLAYGFRFNVNSELRIKLRFAGADETGCFGINNQGQIVGYYRIKHVIHGFVRNP